MPSEPERSSSDGAAIGPAAFDRLGLGLLAVLDDVTGLEEHALGDLAPDRRAAQEKLEVHAEVLELLALGVAHDRLRLGSGSTARRCSYQPIASASSVSEAHSRANVRVAGGSSSGGS